MSTNYGFEPTLDGLNNIDADSSTTTNIICDTIQINTSGTAPTRSPGDNTTNIATTAFVDNATTGVFVDLTTTQTITGQKTFSNANTFITGNTVTNSIQSVINNNLVLEGVGTGDAILKAGGTDRITCADNGAITIAGGSGQPMNITTTGIMTLQSASNTNINIGNNQTSGNLNIGTSSTRTGAVNIATGAITTSVPITIGNQTGAFGSCDIGTTSITVGKSNTDTNSIQTSTNGTLNLKTTSTGGNVNLGTGMTSGSINIGASSATNNILGLTYINGSGTANTGIGNTTGIVDIKGSNMLLNTTGVVTTNIGNILSTTYLNGATFFTGLAPATFNNDIYIQQSTYPSINDSQLGYTLIVAGSAGNTTTNVWKTLNQIDIPSKGVWLFVGLYQLDIAAGQPGDIEQLRFGLSSVAPVSFTRVSNIEYFREADDSVGLNDVRDRLQLSGVFTTTASATYYFSARLRYTGFIASDIQTKGDSTLTRIG